MHNSLRTTISQFSSAGGRQQARASNVRAVEPAPDLPGAERGNLYMLVEVTGSGGGHPALYRQVFDAAQKAFYETEGTTVTALQRAVRAAHGVLRKVNDALPDAAWRAGITCATLQEADLVIAQVSPALALVSHPKTVDQFPPELKPESCALGGEERPNVQVARTQVEPGSMILLADSRWLEYVQPKALAVAAALETPGQAVDYLAQLAGSAELNAVVIGIGQGTPEDSEAPAGLGNERLPNAEPVGPAPEPAERPAPHGSGLLNRLIRLAPVLAGHRDRGTAPAEGQIPVMTQPIVSGTAPEAGLFEAAETFQVETEEQPRRSVWPLVLAVVVIPLLIAVVVLAMWFMRNQSQENSFQQALDAASAAVATAQAQPDENAARQALATAQASLAKAGTIKPGDSRLDPVQTKLDEGMDRVNHVTPLYGVVPLWSFTGDSHKLARVSVNAGIVYVLDTGAGEIDRLALSGLNDSAKPADPPYALQKKQQVPGSDQLVGDLADMVWIDAVSDQRSRLVAFDASGALFSYDTTFGAARLVIGGQDQWGGVPQMISTFNGNLYLVDEKAKQIWRYRPTARGYENPPEPYFSDSQQVDLTGLQSIAIDGNIWLLYADGRLIKYLAGQQQPFAYQGLPTPIATASAVVAPADGDQIYVADTGNGRIVEFSKDTGQFQRDLRPAQGDMLHQLRGLYLDESAGAFYILTDTQLYKADLPAPEAATPTPASQN
jgi:hypothetical protein